MVKSPTPYVPTSAADQKILALIEAALNLQEAGEVEQAHHLLQDVQAKAPNYAAVHLLLGLSYRARGELTKAEASLRQALKLDPDQPEVEQALGLVLLLNGQIEQGVVALQSHLRWRPNDPVTLRALSKALHQVGKTDEAIDLLRARWVATNDMEVGIVYGRFLLRLGQLIEAEHILRAVAETHANQPRPQAELAYALLVQNAYAEAEHILRQLTESHPGYDRAWRGLAEVYLNTGQLDAALDAADHALAIDAQHYRNWLIKTRILQRLGRVDESLGAAQAGVACGPSDDVEANSVMIQLRLAEAEALLNQGKNEEGLGCLERLRHDFPDVLDVVVIQCHVLLHFGRFEQALDIVDAAMDKGADIDGPLTPLRFEILHLLGRADEAWRFIEPHLASRQDLRVDMLAGIGVSLYAQGHIAAARAIHEQLVAFVPDVSRIWSNLGFILTGENELETAHRCISHALQLTDTSEQEAISAANLAYLNLLAGRFDQAQEQLKRVVATAPAELAAIQRVAYWYDGQVITGYSSHPTRFLPVAAAALANQVTIALAKSDTAKAEILAHDLITQLPETSLGHEVMGWVQLALNHPDAARSSWQLALELATTQEEIAAYQSWLQQLQI